MPNIDFDSLQFDSEIEWPARGRRAKPLPESLIKALHESFANQSVPVITVPSEKINTFVNLLNRAGLELNYRIEKVIKVDEPEPGLTTVHFRTRHHRKSRTDA